ncbi:MAG: hypothetical protein WCU80_02210 [Paludibacteraceae bacterium]|nr:hypothetical protein [Prevotellaceae bacterium]
MLRFAANILYKSPYDIIRNGVIEMDESGIVRAVFSLDDLRSESESTQFLNGIILPFQPDIYAIDSKKENLTATIRPITSYEKNQIKEGEKTSLWHLSGDGLFNGDHTQLSLVQIL